MSDSAAYVARFAYWLVTGGEGDLPVALRVSWKVLTWGIVAILVYVMDTTPRIDTFGLVVMAVLAACFVGIALFSRLGWD